MRKGCPVLTLALGLSVFGAAAAGEQAGGAQKLRLATVADSPDPYSPPVAGDLAIEAVFEARPTDAGAGSKKNEKRFAVRVSAEIADQAGNAVRSLSEEFSFQFPVDLPANDYHTVPCTVYWTGTDAAGDLVEDEIDHFLNSHVGSLLVRANSTDVDSAGSDAAADVRSQIADCRLQIADCRLNRKTGAAAIWAAARAILHGEGSAVKGADCEP